MTTSAASKKIEGRKTGRRGLLGVAGYVVGRVARVVRGRRADEAYDALHQWEDATVAAAHAAARRTRRR